MQYISTRYIIQDIVLNSPCDTPEAKKEGCPFVDRYITSLSIPTQGFDQVVGITPEVDVRGREGAAETTLEVFCQPCLTDEMDKPCT